MSQSSSPIIYLPLPEALHAAVKEAINTTYSTVVSHSEMYASNFDLPDNQSIRLVKEEAINAYKKVRGNIL
ncbi:hypothetical protein PHISCL_06440 [Aspergillus sclerotialis]|uniref:Uncharacterized protein n=1 Tax=Aspergillus sclerotialis TaxID=2070753 RepID=A0A3A2ZIJ6_9EURO|nr:hypothetical protein PHISCL_06440 [Aspergillus sclerotialis]